MTAPKRRWNAASASCREETGAIGTGYLSLGKLYPSPGYCGEIIHLYVCRVESFGSQNPDEDEFLKVERIPLNRAAERYSTMRFRMQKHRWRF